MNFTQMPVSQGCKYLLVMIDTLTGWIEGFPTQTEKAEEVVKTLLHEIMLRFQSPIVQDIKKGAQKWHEGNKQLVRQLREQHYRTMT